MRPSNTRELVVMTGAPPITRSELEEILDARDVRWRAELDARDVRWRAELDARDERWRAELDARDERWRAEQDRWRADLRAERRAEMQVLFEQQAQQIQAMINGLFENWRREIAVVDEKYQDLPGQHANLRAEVEAHVSDASVHVARRRTRTPSPRGARRRRRTS